MVELLVPELQRRGIYWDDYAAPGGTARENLHAAPGYTQLAADHPGAAFKWSKASAEAQAENPVEVEKAETAAVEIKSTGAEPATVTVAAV